MVSAVTLRAVWGVLTLWCWCWVVYSPTASLGMLHVYALLCLCLGLAAFYALAAGGRYHAGALIARGRGSFAGTRSCRIRTGFGWVRCALYMLCFCTFCQAAASAPIARASAEHSPLSQPHSCLMGLPDRELDSRQARPHPSGHAAPSRKRALRRAIGRAARHPMHTTTYKGRSCTLQNLTGRLPNVTFRPAPRRRASQTDCHRGPRLRAMTWNTGGLSSDAWLELQIWLHEQEDHDIIFLQETHWRFCNSWCLPRYHLFHSGSSDHRYQGLPDPGSENACAL